MEFLKEKFDIFIQIISDATEEFKWDLLIIQKIKPPSFSLVHISGLLLA